MELVYAAGLKLTDESHTGSNPVSGTRKLKMKINLKIILFLLIMCYNNLSVAKTFNECDIDKDLKLSFDEVSFCNLEDIKTKFKELDLNKDGFLDKSELKANR